MVTAAKPGATARPSDQALPIRTARPAKTPIPRSRTAGLASPIFPEWTAYQSRLAKIPDARAGSAPQIPWWASQVPQKPTVSGQPPISRTLPADSPSAVPPLAIQPNPASPPAISAQAAIHFPAVQPKVPEEATRPEPSHLLGIVIISFITVLVFALKGLSIRRRKIRIRDHDRQYPMPEKSLVRRTRASIKIDVPVPPLVDVFRFRADGDAAWISFGKTVTVGRRMIAGPAYVGSRLPTSNSSSKRPSLAPASVRPSIAPSPCPSGHPRLAISFPKSRPRP
jgi:hypothetical protein